MPVSDIEMPETMQQQQQQQLQTAASVPTLSLPELVRRSISKAMCEDRLQIGLNECIDYLYSCDPNKVLMVALTDASCDMLLQTMLEVFCYEHTIPFVKIDSRILSRVIRPTQIGRLARTNSDPSNEHCCFLIAKPANLLQAQNKYQEELHLLKVIRECELRDEPLVILNSVSASRQDPR